MNHPDKVINANSLYLLAVALFSLIVFSLNGSIVSTYGQLSPGNNSTATQLDSAQKSPDNGQLIATPGPSENDLGITKEQSNINNEENKEDQPQIQPQIQQQKQDKEEDTSDNSDEVDGDNIPSNSEQDIEEKQGQKGQGDEEGKNNDDSKKENNDDIRLDWMPFP
ncbi:hypothetical protein BH18THE2_BH18THE2_38470 [soil metagenome]